MTADSQHEPGAGANQRSVSDAVLVAVIPLVGYSYAFAYEAGYCHRFRVPWWLIRIDLFTVLVVTAVTGMALVSLWLMVQNARLRPWGVLAYHLVEPLVLLWIAWLVADATEWAWGAHLIVPLLLMFITLTMAARRFGFAVMAPLRNLGGDSPWERWRAELHRQASRKRQSNTVGNAVMLNSRTGVPLRLLGASVMALFTLTLALGAGNVSAHQQRHFS